MAHPGEWHNLADDPGHAAVRQQMQQALQRWMRETGDFLPPDDDVPNAAIPSAERNPY